MWVIKAEKTLAAKGFCYDIIDKNEIRKAEIHYAYQRPHSVISRHRKNIVIDFFAMPETNAFVILARSPKGEQW